jgi:hypothetical protein
VQLDVPGDYYRFVRGEVATIEDFIPQGAMGRTMRHPASEQMTRAWNEGISVYDDFDHACALAKALGYGPGSFIATLSLPTNHGLEIAPTGKDLHHYTIFAAPEHLLTLVHGDPVRIPGAPEK